VTEALFTEFSWTVTFDVVSSVGGPQTGLMTRNSDDAAAAAAAADDESDESDDEDDWC